MEVGDDEVRLGIKAQVLVSVNSTDKQPQLNG